MHVARGGTLAASIAVASAWRASRVVPGNRPPIPRRDVTEVLRQQTLEVAMNFVLSLLLLLVGLLIAAPARAELITIDFNLFPRDIY